MISYSILSGESADVDTEVKDNWKSRIEELCKGYEEKDIFNCNESAFFKKNFQLRHWSIIRRVIKKGKEPKRESLYCYAIVLKARN